MVPQSAFHKPSRCEPRSCDCCVDDARITQVKSSIMPRTRAQRRATQGLLVLGDDALRNVLTFLTPSVCALGPGATSKVMRDVSSSKELKLARTSGSYVLRPWEKGVVHALATGFGTRKWPERSVQRARALDREVQLPSEQMTIMRVPPPGLQITAHRLHPILSFDYDYSFVQEEPYASWWRTTVVDPNIHLSRCTGGGECSLRTGSWVQYELPIRLVVSHFRLWVGNCGCRRFKDWTFDAFDGAEWRQLYLDGPGALWDSGNPGQPMTFLANATFAASRFRIRLADSDETRRCMHLRGIDLFGEILPGWSLD